MKLSKRYILEGNKCLVCDRFLSLDGHSDECLVPVIAQLEVLNTQLEAELTDYLKICQNYVTDFQALQVENEALREYITHKPGCNVYYAVYERDAKPVCNCGFDTLLTGKKPETPLSDVPITP